MANETVTFDLATVLGKMDARLDRIEATQNTILVNQVRLEGKIDALETKFDGEIKAVKSDIATIKDTQSKQIWALIGVLATGVIGALIINSWRFWTNVV